MDPHRSRFELRTNLFHGGPLLLGLFFFLSACGAPESESDSAVVEELPVSAAQAELDQLNAQLGELEQRALQDAAVLSARTDMVNSVREAGDTDPAMLAKVDEMTRVVTESNAARARGDTATANELDSRYTTLDAELTTMRGAVAQRPEVAPHVEAYNSLLLRKMIELEPTAESSIRRLFALRDSL